MRFSLSVVVVAGVVGACALEVHGAVHGGRRNQVQNAPAPASGKAIGGRHATYKQPAQAINEFAFHLARAVAEKNPRANLLISPLSVCSVHSMLLAGATGDTQRELHDALAFADPPNAMHRELHLVVASMTATPGKEMHVANAFFPLEPTKLRPSFEKTLNGFYGAQITQLDGRGPDALAKINDWANKGTAGLVPQVLDHLNWNATYVVANAATFIGKWDQPFDPTYTHDRPFKLADGGTVQVPTMFLRETAISYMHSDELEAARLKYGGSPFCMLILLPVPTSNISALMGRLDSKTWDKIVAGLATTDCVVWLPKFTLDADYDLIPAMESMGVNRLFDPRAELGGISNGAKVTWIGQDVHVTHIEVDEKGTKAAAATAAVSTLKGPSHAIYFNVDRPFVYAILDSRSGAIAFLGVCGDPSLKK